MSENSLDYAQMIEIPVNTCTVTYKRSRKKKKRRDDLKNQLLDKVNKKVFDETAAENQQISFDENAIDGNEKPEKIKKIKQKDELAEKKGGFNVVMLEFIIVCVLCAAIFLTNLFIPDSGINTFLRNTFMSSDTASEDLRNYTDFTATLPVKNENILVEEGVMTLSGSESIYAPCDGVLTSLTKGEDGLYVMEISHNNIFKTIISGANFAYYNVGDTVYSAIPVAYIDEGEAKVYMYNDGSLLSNYILENGSIIWQV
jgi:hypothetical protein